MVVADIAEAGNQETARQINDLGGGALPVKCEEHAKKLPQPSSGCVRMPLLSLGNVRIVRRTFFKVDGSRCRHGGDYLGEWVGASDSNTN